jgi:hypothetical protein
MSVSTFASDFDDNKTAEPIDQSKDSALSRRKTIYSGKDIENNSRNNDCDKYFIE